MIDLTQGTERFREWLRSHNAIRIASGPHPARHDWRIELWSVPGNTGCTLMLVLMGEDGHEVFLDTPNNVHATREAICQRAGIEDVQPA